MAPLQEVLAAGRLKYLDLLGGALAAAIAEALHRDAQVGPLQPGAALSNRFAERSLKAQFMTAFHYARPRQGS